MKILIIGGTGAIGGHAAQILSGEGHGHEIAIASRHAPAAGSPLARFPFLPVDYVGMEFDRDALRAFDAIIFSAGNDIRQFPKGGDDSWYDKVNTVGVPRFFEELKRIGVPRVVNISSFYPHVMPKLVEGNAYIRSRKNAEDGVAALSDANFHANSVSAPFVVGVPDGVSVPMFEAYVRYAEGALAPMPEFLPGGGTNFISTRSLAEAAEGALLRGEGGRSYLVGDENMSFADYFGAFFDAVGRARPEVRGDEHPMLPDGALFFGRGNTLYYEVNEDEVQLLGYRRHDIVPAIRSIVAQYRKK